MEFKDIIRPKKEIYKFLKNNTKYMHKRNKVDKSKENYEFGTEKEYLSSLYDTISNTEESKRYIDVATHILNAYDGINKTNLEKLLFEDSIFKFKLLWLGKTICDYKNI